MISHDYKFIFFDIVKTGGSSINQVLVKYGGMGKHHAVSRPLPLLPINAHLDRIVPQSLINEYYTFTIIRNPYDRLISLFSYCQNAPLQKAFLLSGWAGIKEVDEHHTMISLKEQQRKTYWPTDIVLFVEWLIHYQLYYCDFTLEKYISMSDWLNDDKGAISVDFIGRYETLEQDIRTIFNHLNIPFEQLPKVNQSEDRQKNYAVNEIYHNDYLKDLIKNHYREDFERFDYPIDFKHSQSYKKLYNC